MQRGVGGGPFFNLVRITVSERLRKFPARRTHCPRLPRDSVPGPPAKALEPHWLELFAIRG